MATVRPFRALRYDPAAAGPLERLVAPPYDVISPAEREELAERSPHNVVRLTLPESEQRGGRDARGVAAGRRPRARRGAVVLGAPAGLRRPRRRRADAHGPRRRAARWSRTSAAPSCRTSARTGGPRRSGCASCARRGRSCEPIFLLYRGAPRRLAAGAGARRRGRGRAALARRRRRLGRRRARRPAAADRRRASPLRDRGRLPRGGRRRGERAGCPSCWSASTIPA